MVLLKYMYKHFTILLQFRTYHDINKLDSNEAVHQKSAMNNSYMSLSKKSTRAKPVTPASSAAKDKHCLPFLKCLMLTQGVFSWHDL